MNLHSKPEKNENKVTQSVNRYGTLASQKSQRDYLIDINDSKKLIKPSAPIYMEVERHDPRPQNYEEEEDQGRFSKTSLNKIESNNNKYTNVFDSKPEMLDKVDLNKMGGSNTRYTVMPKTDFQTQFQESPMTKYPTNQPPDQERKRINTLFPKGTFSNGK